MLKIKLNDKIDFADYSSENILKKQNVWKKKLKTRLKGIIVTEWLECMF